MQYIPVSQTEILEVPCKITIGEVEVETTFLTLSSCGGNEIEVMKLASVGENDTRTMVELYRDVLNFLCKGYVVSGERILFKDGEKASDYFSFNFAKWFYNNIEVFNALAIEQKKS